MGFLVLKQTLVIFEHETAHLAFVQPFILVVDNFIMASQRYSGAKDLLAFRAIKAGWFWAWDVLSWFDKGSLFRMIFAVVVSTILSIAEDYNVVTKLTHQLVMIMV